MKRAGLIAIMLVCATSAAKAGPLYVGSSLPTAQGWSFLALNGTSVLPEASLASLDPAGFVNLNTTTANPNSIRAGYARIAPLLDNAPGFRLDFSARLLSENHGTDNDRAGFSLIVTDNTKHAIELAFWQDHIWAQDVGFTHGGDVAFDTTVLTDYSLSVIGSKYSFTAGNGALKQTLSGTTQSYTAPGVFGLPYRTEHFLFFGDDTTSASASVALQSISVQSIPEPSSFALLASGLALVALTAVGRRTTQS